MTWTSRLTLSAWSSLTRTQRSNFWCEAASSPSMPPISSTIRATVRAASSASCGSYMPQGMSQWARAVTVGASQRVSRDIGLLRSSGWALPSSLGSQEVSEPPPTLSNGGGVKAQPEVDSVPSRDDARGHDADARLLRGGAALLA